MISIHAPRAGRDPCHQAVFRRQRISIHAPRAGRDSVVSERLTPVSYFNPRAPCGARPRARDLGGVESLFQSTRPVRGATCHIRRARAGLPISIHAPRAGRDRSCWMPAAQSWHFNPRAPCGARLALVVAGAGDVPISIHAPRAGRDRRGMRRGSPGLHFNPRAPCGARQQKYTKLLYTLLRQKAILRQFHAKRRLLKRFSTYKYRNTFLICSANRMGKICTLPLRTTRSLDLPEGMSACSQSARFCFRTFFPSSKTADYPALDP